jgi:hypothetical protein
MVFRQKHPRCTLTHPGITTLRSENMSFTNLQQGTLITGDAYVAPSGQKRVVDSAREKIRVAERETVGVAIGRQQGDDPLRTLRDAAEGLAITEFRICRLAGT